MADTTITDGGLRPTRFEQARTQVQLALGRDRQVLWATETELGIDGLLGSR